MPMLPYNQALTVIPPSTQFQALQFLTASISFLSTLLLCSDSKNPSTLLESPIHWFYFLFTGPHPFNLIHVPFLASRLHTLMWTASQLSLLIPLISPISYYCNLRIESFISFLFYPCILNFLWVLMAFNTEYVLKAPIFLPKIQAASLSLSLTYLLPTWMTNIQVELKSTTEHWTVNLHIPSILSIVFHVLINDNSYPYSCFNQ